MKLLKNTNKLNNQTTSLNTWRVLYYVGHVCVCECGKNHRLWVFDVYVESIIVHREIYNISSIAFMYMKIVHSKFQ